MSVPIILPKLFIPGTRPDLVSRSHLIDQLNTGLHRKLTLISAPAGFGKTTVVTEWIRNLQDESPSENPTKIAWYSLDEGDNDPNQFLTYWISALNQINGLESIGVLIIVHSFPWIYEILEYNKWLFEKEPR